MRYKETHGPTNVSFPEDKSLSQFCVNARYARKNPGKGIRLTEERIAAEIELDWTEYVTRSFDERMQELEEYRQTHGHVNVKIQEDNSLQARTQAFSEDDGTRKLTEERIARLAKRARLQVELKIA
jgi:hypothetical protein